MAKDYYEVLGVNRSASPDEIKKAYRKLSRQHHPDVKPGDKEAEARFKEVQEAYAVVGDVDKRKKYDQFGHAFEHAGGGPGGFNWGSAGAGGQQFDFEQMFGGGGIDLGDLFGGGAFGRGGRGGKARQQKGQDVEATIQVPFTVAAEGGNHDLSISTNGKTERLTVKVPPGVDTGSVIRLAGQGQPGRGGGPNGDLLVRIQVASHPYFRRDGANILVDVPVSIAEAALGAKVDVPTLSEGLVSLTVPASSSSGTKLRLRGKGVLDAKTKARGDQFAILKVVVPKNLDDTSRELLQQFAARNSGDPRAGLW